MPSKEAANPHLREAQRAKILEGARNVFARKGTAATMADVAVAAGVSQGLAYRYFANKEEIFHELVEQTIRTDPAGLQHVDAIAGTPVERLAVLLSRLVEARRQHPEFFQLFDQVQNSEATPNDLRELIRRHSQTFHDVVRQLIVEGQVSGEVAAGDPDQLVTALIACLEGLTRVALHNPEQFKRHYPDPSILLRMLKA